MYYELSWMNRGLRTYHWHTFWNYQSFPPPPCPAIKPTCLSVCHSLLITSMGHIKLTDFGLSKMGIMNRECTSIHQNIQHLYLPDVKNGFMLYAGTLSKVVVSWTQALLPNEKAFKNMKPISLTCGPMITPAVYGCNSDHQHVWGFPGQGQQAVSGQAGVWDARVHCSGGYPETGIWSVATEWHEILYCCDWTPITEHEMYNPL